MSINFAQKDSTLAYKTFKRCLVAYFDVGYRSAPFTIYYPFTNDINKLQFKNNFQPAMGIGGSYSWVSFRIGFSLPFNLRSVAKYGDTKFLDLGIDFTLKRTFWDLDYLRSVGYSIINANKFNDSLNSGNPNDIRAATNLNYIGLNMWYFPDKNFKMTYFRGKAGHYERQVLTWYIKSSINSYGINNGTNNLIAENLIDTANTKTGTSAMSAFDIGAIPGVAYVNRIKNWQFGAMFGIGPMTQVKSYVLDGENKTFSGLVARYDFKVIGGYSKNNFFAMFESQWNNKTISFDNFKFKMYYYNLKISIGYRFPIRFNPHKLLP